MKTVINTIYDGLISWAEMIYEYRQSPASRYHYWK